MFQAEESQSFFGIIYVNFTHFFVESEVEMRFVETMARVVIECGRLAPALARMREEVFSRIQGLNNPTEIFRQVLDVALEEVRRMIPQRSKGSAFQLGGNISMVAPVKQRPLVADGAQPARLRIRTNVGDISKNFPAVQDAGEGIVGTVAVSGEALIIDDTRETPNYMPYLRGMRCELAVPIVIQGEVHTGFAENVVGVLNIECSEPKVFTARHKTLISKFMQVPIASILHVAERHHQLLLEDRRELDEWLIDSSMALVHNITKPARLMESRARLIRENLPLECVERIEPQLQELERESRRTQELQRTGLLYLNSEILQARHSLDVVDHVSHWANRQTPPVEIRWKRKQVHEFYIDSGHPILITSVLDNLYQNSREALQGKEKKANIWLDCKIIDRGGTAGYFDVYFHDNGRGLTVPRQEWPLLFRMSARPRERGSSGWGMGLPLARLMMLAMHGDLDVVVSEPDVDTAFRIRFTPQPRIGR